MNAKKLKRIRKEVCKGCRLYDLIDEGERCRISHKINGKPCPCSICLVKSVCNQACDLIEGYTSYKGNPKNIGIKNLTNHCSDTHINNYCTSWGMEKDDKKRNDPLYRLFDISYMQ